MDKNKIIIEIFSNGRWVQALEVGLVGSSDKGIKSATSSEYLLDYSLDGEAVSLTLPVSFEVVMQEHWPSFLLDLIPSGAGRRFWLKRLGLGEGPHADWSVLSKGGFNPPGRIRVKTSMISDESSIGGDGFKLEEVVNRSQDFLYYIEHYGGPVKGATGAGGDAPKYLLREDFRGRFHADLALEDSETKSYYMMKYPRGRRTGRDKEVLKGECYYYQLAHILGLGTLSQPLKYIEFDSTEALLIPRMDRIRGNEPQYLGLESLYAANEICDWPYTCSVHTLVPAIFKYSDMPLDDFTLYVKRDLANMIFGNTDNHGRNSAFLVDGRKARLSPIFDFAPMMIDPEGITRTVRWRNEKAGYISIEELINECRDILKMNNFSNELDGFMENICRFINSCQEGMTFLFDEAKDCKILLKNLKENQKYLKQLVQNI